MSADPIHDLLAGIAKPYMDLPRTHVAAPFGHVEAHGLDLKAARTWVEDHDGWVENPPEPDVSRLRPGRVVASTRPNHARFVIPVSALNPMP